MVKLEPGLSLGVGKAKLPQPKEKGGSNALFLPLIEPSLGWSGLY